MMKKIWRWIKKAFIVNLVSGAIMLIILMMLGITDILSVVSWIKIHPLMFLLIYTTTHLILEGWLIEWVNRAIK